MSCFDASARGRATSTVSRTAWSQARDNASRSWRGPRVPTGTAYSMPSPASAGQKGEFKDHLRFAALSPSRIRAGAGSMDSRPLATMASRPSDQAHIEVVSTGQGGSAVPARGSRGRRGGAEARRRNGHRGARAHTRTVPFVTVCLSGVRPEFDPPARDLSFTSPQGLCLADRPWVQAATRPDLVIPKPALVGWDGAIERSGRSRPMGQTVARRHSLHGGLPAKLSRSDGPGRGDHAQRSLARTRAAVQQALALRTSATD